MLSLRFINRSIQNKAVYPATYKCILQTYCSGSDSDSEKTKSKPVKREKKLKSDEARQKLNVLLKQMIQDDTNITSNKLNLAKPKPKIRNDNVESDTISSKSESVEKKIIFAAKNVAQSLGGNTKQTESELLSKLLSSTGSSADDEPKNKSLNLSDVISGMKIDRTVKPTVNNEVSRAHQVRQLLDRTSGKRDDVERKPINKFIRKPKYSPQSDVEKIDLFGSKPLGIFTTQIKPEQLKKDTINLMTWNALHERELRLAVTHPPENYFQEMILWTKQGKVWKFPIDNEQGMEEEQNVYFADHIFLEKHLENWCPAKGPIRHFMELVCVGLSKNPYLSAQAKKDHILWFKDYFLSKKQLLEEIGAMPTATNIRKELEQ